MPTPSYTSQLGLIRLGTSTLARVFTTGIADSDSPTSQLGLSQLGLLHLGYVDAGALTPPPPATVEMSSWYVETSQPIIPFLEVISY